MCLTSVTIAWKVGSALSSSLAPQFQAEVWPVNPDGWIHSTWYLLIIVTAQRSVSLLVLS